LAARWLLLGLLDLTASCLIFLSQVVLILPTAVLAYVLARASGEPVLVVAVGARAALWAAVWWLLAGTLARRVGRLAPEARRWALPLTIVLLAALGLLPVHGAGGQQRSLVERQRGLPRRVQRTAPRRILTDPTPTGGRVKGSPYHSWWFSSKVWA
jgi:hypothetical protein